MNEQLFRKKTIDQLSDPDQLGDYIHVTNPGVWMVLVTIIAFLVGVCVWASVAKVTTVVVCAGISDGQTVTCYVNEDDYAYVQTGMTVYINDGTYTVSSIDTTPFTLKEDSLNEYALRVGELSIGEWVYAITLTGDAIEDGVYEANIVVENLSPFYFVFN